MKAKHLLLGLPVLAGLAIAGMTPPPPSPPPSEAKVNIDLAAMNRTMVYSQIFELLSNPERHVGKTVRMSGTYATDLDEETGVRYHACLISDAMACCAQGIEFAATNAVAWPDDFPSEGAPIRVEGVFDIYHERNRDYVRIRDAVLAFRKNTK